MRAVVESYATEFSDSVVAYPIMQIAINNKTTPMMISLIGLPWMPLHSPVTKPQTFEIRITTPV